MYFEYPHLLWLLAIPALLVVRYLWIEFKDRRAHLRVSALDAWKAGGISPRAASTTTGAFTEPAWLPRRICWPRWKKRCCAGAFRRSG